MTSLQEHNVRITKRAYYPRGHPWTSVEPHGVVVFAHGSGSGRFSPRNNPVARHLQQDGLATLLLDLLTEDENGSPQGV
jgi:putative phosphoribosyl transferase